MTSEAVDLDCVPPQDVQPRVSVRTRCGAASASSWATIPPIEIPSTWASAIANASSSASASAASPAIVRSPPHGALRPIPRWS